MINEPTTRIREDLARATLGFLVHAKSRLDAAFAGLIARAHFEPVPQRRGQSTHGFHVVDWKPHNITPQQIVDELLLLKEREGEFTTSHERTLSFVIEAWDKMIWHDSQASDAGR